MAVKKSLLFGCIDERIKWGLFSRRAGTTADRQSGFCKAFSDEPEMFAHGMSPLRDMLVNLNMTNVMIWPRWVSPLYHGKDK
jgi:hypothetical protein